MLSFSSKIKQKAKIDGKLLRKGAETYDSDFTIHESWRAEVETGRAEQIIRIAGGVPAIVSVELWNRVNKRMDTQKQRSSAGRSKQFYLLSGLVYCGECGAAMCGNSRKPSPTRDVLITYRCSNRHNKAMCANRELKRDSLESFVLTQLEQHFFREDVIPSLTRQLNDYLNATNAEAIGHKAKLAAQQLELKREKSNIIDAIAKTGLQDTFAERLSTIEQELDHINAQFAYSDKTLASTEITEDMVRGYLSSFQEFVKQRDIPQIKTFIDSYVDRAEVFQTHVNLIFKIALTEGSSHASDTSNTTYTFGITASRRQLKERSTA